MKRNIIIIYTFVCVFIGFVIGVLCEKDMEGAKIENLEDAIDKKDDIIEQQDSLIQRLMKDNYTIMEA